MRNFNKYAILGMVVSIMFILAGSILALNACTRHNAMDEPNPDPNHPNNGNNGNTEQPSYSDSHYEGLEKVILTSDLAEQIKEYTGFIVSFNKDNHTPNYVAWELLGSEVSKDIDRTDNFWQDSEIAGCPAHSDYTGSGYDRGHMCPAADQKWSIDAMNDCFVMANMCPQIHDLNAGAWETLENKEREWAKRDSAIMIIAGPIYTAEDTKRMSRNVPVRIPGAFFKVLFAPYVENPRAIAFVYPNMKAPGNMQDYAMSVDDLEKDLGYDFFSSLPDELENKIEATYSFTEWNR